jgi:hypothetical protein
MTNLLLRVGLLFDYRGTFWTTASPLLRTGRIEDMIHVSGFGSTIDIPRQSERFMSKRPNRSSQTAKSWHSNRESPAL